MTLLPQTAQPLKHVLWGVQVNKGLLISNPHLLDLSLTSDDEDMYADVNKTSKKTIICYVFMVVTTEVHAKYTSFLWPPYVIAQAIIFSRCGFYLLSIFYLFFSPNLSGRRLDVYRTSTRGVAAVALVRI